MRFAVEASPERPVLVDKFLEDATEVDVDCIADVGQSQNPASGTSVIGALLEHIEYERLGPNLFSAADVVSRKKQLFPAISRALKTL